MAEYEGQLPFDQEVERLKGDLAIIKGHVIYLEMQAAEKMADSNSARDRYAEKLATDLEWVLRERRVRVCYQTEEHLRGGVVGGGIYTAQGQIGIVEMGFIEFIDYANDQKRINSIDDTGKDISSMILVDASLVRREPQSRARFYCPSHLTLNLMRAGVEKRHMVPFTEREGRFVAISNDGSQYELPNDFKVEVPVYPIEVYRQLGLM